MPTPEEIALVRTYEPILLFHPGERFFPVDPKRYLEECALWSARRPTRSKDDWGEEAPGRFPKTPRTPARKIAAVRSTPTETVGRTWLGNLLARPDRQEDQFLTFADWEDPTSVTTPSVTPGTANRHSSLNKIAEAYRPSIATAGLANSQFWYYAEILDKTALLSLLRQTPKEQWLSLPLEKLVNDLPEPKLILYHLFYPAHEEPLEGCEGFGDGSQFASFAGEWGCVAVLESVVPGITESRAPVVIGVTQRNVGPLSTTDDEGRIGMTVQPWLNVAVEPGHLTHPKVYVARGTHSNYLSTGDTGVHSMTPFSGEAFDISRNSCGQVETVDDAVAGVPAVLPPHAPRGADPIVLAKVGVGGLVPLGVFGLLVGAFSTLAEALIDEFLEPFGTELPGPSPASRPTDVTPSTTGGFGRAIIPLGVGVTEPVTSGVPWRTSPEQAPGGEVSTSDGKRYGFIVDRGTQVWWPTRADRRGYDGRWGAAVDHDPKARRSGMRLPRFWFMFLLALARARP